MIMYLISARKFFFSACVLIQAATVAAADTVIELKVMHPRISIAAPVAPVAGGFLTLLNEGGTPVRLVGASASFADKVEIHRSEMDGGVMKMRKLSNGIVVGAGATVELAHGGLHIMFMKLNRPLTIGAAEEVELQFENAEPMVVFFMVVDGTKSYGH